MALYRLCSVCHKKVPYGSRCNCEIKEQKNKYRTYQKNRTDKREQKFYQSDEWLKFKQSISTHQLGLDLYEWSLGNLVDAEAYHHIIEIKEDWSLRLDADNVLGLTKANHNMFHRYMNESEEKKIKIQKYLKSILEKFEKEFY